MAAQNNVSGSTNRRLSRFPSPPVLRVAKLEIPVVFSIFDAGIRTGVFLPAGSIVLRMDFSIFSFTGGTTPAIDIGLEDSTPDDNALISQYDLTSSGSVSNGGAVAGNDFGSELTEAAEITYTDMSNVQGTGGTILVYVTYAVL